MLELIISLVSFLLGMFVMYLTAYVKEKGKNKALLEDVSRLENEKQAISARYMAEMEELKKAHSLDIEKRKYRYEDKRAQFTKYFTLLDEFNNKSNTVFADKFFPVIQKFWEDVIQNENGYESGLVSFNAEVQKLMRELYEEQMRLTQETNSIRLVSTPEVDVLLDGLEKLITQATEASSDMLKFMATAEFASDQALLAPFQEKATLIGQEVMSCKDKLRSRMKVELDEI